MPDPKVKPQPEPVPEPVKPEVTEADHQKDVRELMRLIIGGVRLEDVTAFDDLEGQERQDFLKYVSEVTSSPFFERVFSVLYYPQIMAAALKAENYPIVTFHRATANGISLVKEFFEKYNRRYSEEFEKKEGKGFEPDKPFDSVDSDQFYKP